MKLKHHSELLSVLPVFQTYSPLLSVDDQGNAALAFCMQSEVGGIGKLDVSVVIPLEIEPSDCAPIQIPPSKVVLEELTAQATTGAGFNTELLTVTPVPDERVPFSKQLTAGEMLAPGIFFDAESATLVLPMPPTLLEAGQRLGIIMNITLTEDAQHGMLKQILGTFDVETAKLLEATTEQTPTTPKQEATMPAAKTAAKKGSSRPRKPKTATSAAATPKTVAAVEGAAAAAEVPPAAAAPAAEAAPVAETAPAAEAAPTAQPAAAEPGVEVSTHGGFEDGTVEDDNGSDEPADQPPTLLHVPMFSDEHPRPVRNSLSESQLSGIYKRPGYALIDFGLYMPKDTKAADVEEALIEHLQSVTGIILEKAAAAEPAPKTVGDFALDPTNASVEAPEPTLTEVLAEIKTLTALAIKLQKATAVVDVEAVKKKAVATYVAELKARM